MSGFLNGPLSVVFNKPLATVTPSRIPTQVPTTSTIIDTPSLTPVPTTSTVIDTSSPIPLTSLSVVSLKPTATTVTPGDKTTMKNTGIATPVDSVKTVTASVDPHNFNDRSNPGTIIGIVIGIMVAMLVLIGGILFLFKRRRCARGRRGLLNVQSSSNLDVSSCLEGTIQSFVLSTSEITNNVAITGRTPKSNLISDITASSNPSDRLVVIQGVPQLLTTGYSSSELESVATGRGATVPDSDAAAQTPVLVFAVPTSPLNPNSRNVIRRDVIRTVAFEWVQELYYHTNMTMVRIQSGRFGRKIDFH